MLWAVVSSPPDSPPATSGIVQKGRQITPFLKTQFPTYRFQVGDPKGLPLTLASSSITPATEPLHELACYGATSVPFSVSP